MQFRPVVPGGAMNPSKAWNFETQRFKTRVLTQNDIENPKKTPFQTPKDHFLDYFNRANVKEHSCFCAPVFISLVFLLHKKVNT